MAIEDGAAMGVLLSNIASKHELPERLRLFEELRLNRVSAMQIFSSVGQDQAAKIADVVRPYVDGPLPSKCVPGVLELECLSLYSIHSSTNFSCHRNL